MNESYNILANLNINTSRVKKYEDGSKLYPQRKNVFEIVKHHNATKVNPRIRRGHTPSSDFISSKRKGAYSEKEVVEKVKKLNSIFNANDGVIKHVYSLDTETLGQPKLFNSNNPTPSDLKNNDIFTVTEFSLLKQDYKDGVAVNGIADVINLSSSRSKEELTRYINSVSKTNVYNSSTTDATLKRIAGSAFEENYSNGEFVRWTPNAPLDNETLHRGASMMGENITLKVNSSEYNKAVNKIYEEINTILNDENSVLTSVNGLGFDYEVLQEMFTNAGIDVGEDFQERMRANTVDIQHLAEAVAKNEIVGLQTNQIAKGVQDVETNMKVKNLVHAANELGADIATNGYHTAKVDTKATLKVIDALKGVILDNGQKVVDNFNNNNVSFSNSIFVANSAVMADPKEDIFFSTSGYDNPNVYNPVLMEAGHSYKISTMSLDNIDELPKELKGTASELKNKKIVRFTDQYGDNPRESFLIVNSDMDLQERILNKKVSVLNNSSNVQDIINNSTEAAIIDKTRVNRENFYNINSDKGFKDFDMYFSMFKEYSDNVDEANIENLRASLKSGSVMINGEEKNVKDALTNLFHYKDDMPLIHERALNLVNMYDDFDSNRDLYDYMLSSVKNGVGLIQETVDTYGLNSQGITAKAFHNYINTSALSSSRDYINNYIIDNLGENEILDYIIQNDSTLKANIEKDIKKRKKYINSLPNEEKVNHAVDYNKIARKAYERRYGEEFYKTADGVIKNIFGLEEVGTTFKELNSIDILSNNGYTRIGIDSKSDFINSLRNNINYTNVAENKNKTASERLRKRRLKEIADDLKSRKIISDDDYRGIIKANTSQGMIEVLGDRVFSAKERFDNLVMGMSTNYTVDGSGKKPIGRPGKAKNVYEALINGQYDANKLSQEDFDFFSSYKKNARVQKIYAAKDGYRVMGMSTSDFLKKRFNLDFSKPNGDFFNGLNKVISNSVPEYMSFSSTIGPNISNEMKEFFKEKFNWTDKNIDTFYNKILNNSEFKSFEYANGKKVDGGITNKIISKDGKYYLVSAPKDMEKSVADKISKNVDIEELRKHAAVFNIPVVEDHGGVKVIKQSDFSYKAVTKDIKLNFIDGDDGTLMPKFDVKDTVDELLEKTGRDIKYSKEKMKKRNFEGAGKVLNRSWSNVYENKTLSSNVVRVKEVGGKLKIFKEVGINRADNALAGMVDMSDIMYALDIALTSNLSLKESFEQIPGSSRVQKEIIKFKNQSINGIDYSSKKTFDKWDINTKMWVADNISEIADTLLNNEEFISSNEKIVGVLTDIRNTGSRGFFGKESGDANRGFFFINSPDLYVAASEYSGTTRPLINQGMSALPIYEDDVKLLAKHNLGIKENVFENLGIKKSHALLTTKADELLDVQSKLNNSTIGFSSKVKIMNPEEFITSFNEIASDDGVKIRNAIKEVLANKGFKGVSDDEIKRAARAVVGVTNVYEDSGLIVPSLASVMQPKTVTTQKIKGVDFSGKSKIEPGDIINSVTGETYRGNSASIVGQQGDSLILQLNKNYRDVKVITGSEKAELHVPQFKDAREREVLETVIKQVSGGANAIMNPNILKHEAFNTILPSYIEAIAGNINDSEIDYVNSVFKKHLGDSQEILFRRSTRDNRINAVMSKKNGTVDARIFSMIIDELSENNSNIKNAITEMNKNNIYSLDLATAQDNTIEGYQGSQNIGKGAAINHRSQSVMGIFVGEEENIDDLLKYRKITGDGKLENLWKEVINSDVEELMNDGKFISTQEQVHNIRNALALNIGDEVPTANIKKINLEDAIVGSSIISADDLPEIFKYAKDGEKRVHGYYIDLSNMNTKINNFMYDELKGAGRDNFIYTNKIQETIDKIFVPALDPNNTPDGYTLTKTQKALADLLTSVNDFEGGNYTKSKNAMMDLINNQYKEYISSLRYDLVDKNGFAKRSLKVKSLHSARLKVAKVAAPIFGKDGFSYLDQDFAKVSTKIINRKKKHYGAVFVSLDDFANQGLTNYSVGMSVLHGKLEKTDEVLNILKSNFSDIQDVRETNHINKAINAITGIEDFATREKDIENIGRQYLEEIGIYGSVMRDPAMKPGSYQAVKIYGRDYMTSGTLNMDAVTAMFMNADGDGDEVNLFFNSLYEDKGITTIKNINEKEVVALQGIMETMSDYNAKEYNTLATDYREKVLSKKMTGFEIDKYLDEIYELRDEFINENGVIDTDYITGQSRLSAYFARYSKASIGQISNPNYYMKSAANSYYSKRAFDPYSVKALGDINYITDLAEQKLIDAKSIKTVEDSIKLSDLITNYRQSIDDLAGGKNKSTNAIISLYKSFAEITGASSLTDKDLETARVVLGFSLGDKNIDEVAQEAAERIVKGNYLKINKGNQSTVEEIIAHMYKAVQDPEGKRVFFSGFVRQGDIKTNAGEYLSEYEKTIRALETDVEVNHSIFDVISSSKYRSSNVFLGDKVLNTGDMIYTLDGVDSLTEGAYSVGRISNKGKFSSIEFIDTNNNRKVIVGKDFEAISNKLSNLKFLPEDQSIDDFINKTFQTELKERYKDNVLNNGLRGYNKFRHKDNNSALKAIEELGGDDIVSDYLGTAEVLKNKGFITEEESSKFIKEMINNIREKGTKEYREIKKEKLLNIDSLKNKYKINASSLNAFINKEVTASDILNVFNTASFEESSKRIKELKRTATSTGSLTSTLNKMITDSDLFENLNEEDLLKVKRLALENSIKYSNDVDISKIQQINKIVSENNYGTFYKNVLGIDSKEAVRLIADGQANELIKSSKDAVIGYGKYIGMTVNDLNSEMIKEILHGDYNSSGIDSELISETKLYLEQILKADEITETVRIGATPVNINIPEDTMKEIVTNAREEINNNIREKGKKVSNSAKNKGKSILDKVSDISSSAKNNKKLILGATAAAATVVAGSYFYGKSKMDEKKGQYVKNNTPIGSNANIKEEEGKAPGRHMQVPTSDTSFYQNAQGVSVNISGKAPVNARSIGATNAVKSLFGNENPKINTSINDSRKQISDREIEDIMVKSMRY